MADNTKQVLRVLQAPVNYANQASLLGRALRAHGVDCSQLCYRFPSEDTQFDERDERSVSLSADDWYGDMLRTVQQVAAEGFDIIHFWNRTLLHWRSGDAINSMDLPVLRLSGARLAFHFTGYDLRRKSLELKLNRFSPYNYGFNSAGGEDDQNRYIDSIAPYIDEFIVQDPELRSYLPGARIIPRALDLPTYPLADQPPNPRPLLVHDPSQPELKGSGFVLQAVEELKAEGLDFDFRLVENMPHAAALALYRRADLIIDQLLIGWYGVLAMEAMAMGKPAVAYIRDDLVGCFPNGLPLLNANPETITAVLRDAIKDRDLRGEIGAKARQFAEQTHDGGAVAEAAMKMYEHMLEAPAAPIVPNFSCQLQHSAEVAARFGSSRSGSAWGRVAELETELAVSVSRIAELEERESRFIEKLPPDVQGYARRCRQLDDREIKHVAYIRQLQADVKTYAELLAQVEQRDNTQGAELAELKSAVQDYGKRLVQLVHGGEPHAAYNDTPNADFAAAVERAPALAGIIDQPKAEVRAAMNRMAQRSDREPARGARTEEQEAEIAALKSALAESVYQKAHSDAFEAEAVRFREQAERWRAIEAELPALRAAAQSYRALEAELPTLREAAQSYRALEPELPQLQYKAARSGELQAEVISLRYKALRYEEVKDKLVGWRSRAERYDRLLATPVVGGILRLLGAGRGAPARPSDRKDPALKPAE